MRRVEYQPGGVSHVRLLRCLFWSAVYLLDTMSDLTDTYVVLTNWITDGVFVVCADSDAHVERARELNLGCSSRRANLAVGVGHER